MRMMRLSAITLAGALLVGCASAPAPVGELREIADGLAFAEGPATDAEGNVFFSDQPNDRILRWDATTGEVRTWMQPSGRANGMEFDGRGRLIVCADAANELRRVSMDGSSETLVGEVGGRLLNGPNDVCVLRDGSMYFTDPWYRRAHWSEHPVARRRGNATPEQPAEAVYLLPRDGGEVRVVADGFVRPNGIAVAPDHRTLYVADIGAGRTYAFPILAGGRLGERRLVVELGSDGMAVDRLGNLYLTGKGVTIVSPAGERIGSIDVPRPWTSNVAFAGRDRSTLVITAGTSVFAIPMSVGGP